MYTLVEKSLVLRRGRPSDARPCGTICYHAFNAIAGAHNFPPDFADTAAAIGLMEYLLGEPSVYSVVAEKDGRIAGSNFLWRHSHLAGVGPITVDPQLQNGSIGRQLMENVLRQADSQEMVGVRLVQAAYHNRSLALYVRLGFRVVEPLSVMQGFVKEFRLPGYTVRKALLADTPACNRLCRHIHGHDRNQELQAGIAGGTAWVVEHLGAISGYTANLGFFGHTVGETNHDIKALIGAVGTISGPGFLLPSRNHELLTWCLEHGLRIVQPLTLMSRGLYTEPAGAFLPSVIY